MYQWNGDWDDLEQVAPYLPAYMARYTELKEAGQYEYNDSFKSHIPGIEGEWEDRAIYLLQGLRRKREQDRKVAELEREGYRWIDAVDAPTRFAHIVLVPVRRMGGEWAEYRDARLIPIEDGVPAYVIPKGKRTHGFLVQDRRVLAYG